MHQKEDRAVLKNTNQNSQPRIWISFKVLLQNNKLLSSNVDTNKIRFLKKHRMMGFLN